MQLNVKERGRHVATFRWVEVRLMETLAVWVPTTPEMEVKLVFGAHIWDVAQHADALGKRTHELRLPEQHSLEPVRGFVDFLAEAARIEDTAKRIAAFYDCVLPGLSRRLGDYVARVDTLLDAPTVRIIERIKADIGRMEGEAHELREEVPAVALGDRAWLDVMRAREIAIADIVVDAPVDQPVASAV